MRNHRLGLFGLLLSVAAAATAYGADGDGVGPAPGANAGRPAEATPAAGGDPWEQIPVVKLRDAVAAGDVVAWGSDPKSFSAVKLHLRNRSGEKVAVDIAGSYLEPKKRGSCQRLGLGPAITLAAAKRRGPGTVIVELDPGKETNLDVSTVCLDAGLPCPNGNEFEASAKTLPAVRENVLRWWADNPESPQISVNVAIWNSSENVHTSPGVVENYARPKGRAAAVHRGLYYRLNDGVLTTVDGEAVVRILGAEVFQIFPTDDGIYAVALGEDRKPKLFLVPMTAETHWTKVLDLDGPGRISEIHSAGRGNLVFVTNLGIDWFDAKAGSVKRVFDTSEFQYASARRTTADTLTVTVRRPPRAPVYQKGVERFAAAAVFELWSVKLGSGKVERDEQFWNVGAMLAGSNGVYALSHVQGQLRRLAGDKFTDLGPAEASYRKIVAAAGGLVWLSNADGRLVAVDAKTGARRIRTSIDADLAKSFDVDPATGDFAYVLGDEFRWIHAADGREETLPAR